MKAFHIIGEKRVSGNVPDSSSFMLANRKGGFLNFAGTPVSRYNGWFFNNNLRMLRIVEGISLVNAPGPSEIINRLYCVERKRKNLVERFFIPHNKDSFVYELSEPYLADVTLDIRDAYDSRQWGRDYKVGVERGRIIVEFTKKTNVLEDITHDSKEYGVFLAIRHDGTAKLVKNWIYRDYTYDSSRKSFPSSMYVFSLMEAVAKKIVFSAALEKETALKEVNYVYDNYEELVKLQKSDCSSANDAAQACALKSLEDLSVGNGMLAGFPWFFQFWSRDEAVSGRALMLSGKKSDFKRILLSRLNSLQSDGRTPNLFGKYSSSSGSAPDASADGIGWVSLRINDLLASKSLSPKEIAFVSGKLTESVANIRKNYERDGLIYNRGLETWMDTAVGSDNREGFRIEIQALQIAMYGLLYKLTKKQEYLELEKKLAGNVKALFWNGNILADGLNDFTPRPNAFIAAYAYPGLLEKDEWVLCFNNLLKSLWLEWGGLASIDKNSTLFNAEHSGEPPYSYHRGDSWFWLNNLAAIVMNRTDSKAFKGYIKRIYNASANDILWNGCIGSHSELSSAKEQRAEGCINQAWSSAMFIELANELKK